MSEKLTKCRNFTLFYWPKNAEVYIIIARKYCSRFFFFGGGGRPVSYAYVHKLIENLGLFNYKKKSRMTFIIIIIIVVVVVC